tara:strand:+ start:624 stop:1073 length:450 start_codon:yes stop_codon:yes gene_type:complete
LYKPLITTKLLIYNNIQIIIKLKYLSFIKMGDEIQQTSPEQQIIYELVNRVRILESKQNLFSEKMLVMNRNMIEEYKRVMEEMKKLNGSLKGFQEDLDNMRSVVRHLSEEASKFAMKEDVKILEKYINLWDPLKFVTESDVKEMIKKNA